MNYFEYQVLAYAVSLFITVLGFLPRVIDEFELCEQLMVEFNMKSTLIQQHRLRD
jgi:hypothetical protein